MLLRNDASHQINLWSVSELLTGEELSQLKTAVTGVKEALADLKANTDPARAAVIKLNVRDARDSLKRRLSQISPETTAIQVVFCPDAIHCHT